MVDGLTKTQICVCECCYSELAALSQHLAGDATARARAGRFLWQEEGFCLNEMEAVLLEVNDTRLEHAKTLGTAGCVLESFHRSNGLQLFGRQKSPVDSFP